MNLGQILIFLRKFLLSCFCVLFFAKSTVAINAQELEACKSFYVESWYKGKQQIENKELNIMLDANKPEYQTIIKDAFGQEKYKVYIKHYPVTEVGPPYEYWDVKLYEIKHSKYSNYNLLVSQKPGTVGDYFPKEDNIGFLYPLEEPVFIRDGILAYPFSAQRVVKVRGFYCIIQVTKYAFSKTNMKTLDFLYLNIIFTNKYPLNL